MPYLELLGYVCDGSKFGLATLVVSDQFFKFKRSWMLVTCSVQSVEMLFA